MDETLASLKEQEVELLKKISEAKRTQPHLQPDVASGSESSKVEELITISDVKEKIQEIHKGIFELYPESMSKQTTLQMLETILMWVGTAKTEY